MKEYEERMLQMLKEHDEQKKRESFQKFYDMMEEGYKPEPPKEPTQEEINEELRNEIEMLKKMNNHE